MTTRRRPALHLTAAALMLALLAAALYVVPGSSLLPSSKTTHLVGSGSTTFAPQGDLVGDAPTSDSHHGPTGDSQGRFGVTVGAVSGLYPGKMQRIPIVFHNPLPYAISVRTATTTAIGPRGCPIDQSLLLRTRTFIHRVVVTSHGSKAKSLRFGMLKTATDPCQLGTFTVTVTASAVRA